MNAALSDIGGTASPWLVAVDLQRVFAEPPSPGASPAFQVAADGIERLLPAFAGRTLFIRYVAPARPAEDHERALAAMALFAPLIEITTVELVLAG